METSNRNEKVNKLYEEHTKQIYVTSITIHQSIFFLLLKLLAVETIAAIGIIAFHWFILSTHIFTSTPSSLQIFTIPFFITLVILKIFIMGYIIIEWLEEYYEISPREVIHRRGVLFKKEQRFTLKHLGKVTVEQNTLGRLFHYGSLTLYDWVTEKNIELYLIHNPLKYHRILQDIAPEADLEKVIMREHLIDDFE